MRGHVLAAWDDTGNEQTLVLKDGTAVFCASTPDLLVGRLLLETIPSGQGMPFLMLTGKLRKVKVSRPLARRVFSPLTATRTALDPED